MGLLGCRGGEEFLDPAVEVSGCGGDGLAWLLVAGQADGGVAQGGQDAGQAAGADLGSVFVEGDIAGVVDAVSMSQWPRMIAASRAGVAWPKRRLVIA